MFKYYEIQMYTICKIIKIVPGTSIKGNTKLCIYCVVITLYKQNRVHLKL